MKKPIFILTALAAFYAVGADRIGPLTTQEFVRGFDKLNNAYDRKVTDRKVNLTEAEARELFDRADKICNGIVYFYKTEEIPVGRKEIDWFGGQKAHQEWIAQLNRFFMLETLMDAYRQNQDEKYAERARELMEDWFNFWQKNDYRFLDPQRDNQLNASIRIRNWILALAVFRDSRAFDDAFVERVIEMLARQTNRLADRTEEGDSNWQIAQSFALLEAGMALDFLPDSAGWREKGTKVLNACFKRQFRPDGSHVENTVGYHTAMVYHMVDAGALGQLRPELGLAADLDVIEKSLQFAQLSRPFAFNDTSYIAGAFPKWRVHPDMSRLAGRAGITDWKPLQYGAFKDAGLIFGGNDREKFFFDAGKFAGWHTHMSRLAFEFAADGYLLLVDPAITTYERKDPHYEYGRTTYSHATVNFNEAYQVQADATLLDVRLSDRFGIAVGEFNAGSFDGEFKNHAGKNIDGSIRRALLWLDRKFLLVFDLAQIKSTPDGKTMTNYVFPAAPMEKWRIDHDRLWWYSQNVNKPNLLIQMLLPPTGKTRISCAEGVKEPKLRGWSGTTRADMIVSPTVQFSADTRFNQVSAVTMLSAFAADSQAPVAEIESARPGAIDFKAADAVNRLRYAIDFQTPQPLNAAGVEAEAVLLLLHGERIFVYRAGNLSVKGKDVPLESAEFTGWIN